SGSKKLPSGPASCSKFRPDASVISANEGGRTGLGGSRPQPGSNAAARITRTSAIAPAVGKIHRRRREIICDCNLCSFPTFFISDATFGLARPCFYLVRLVRARRFVQARVGVDD